MHPTELLVQQAIHACGPLLQAQDIDRLTELNAHHGEFGLALETLADVLCEQECALTEPQKAAIAAARDRMALPNDSRWAALGLPQR